MRRTITMKFEDAFYRRRRLGYVTRWARDHFLLRNSNTHKYVITITEGSHYRICYGECPSFYEIHELKGSQKIYAGCVCRKKFNKLFFEPVMGQLYDITVKKVKK